MGPKLLGFTNVLGSKSFIFLLHIRYMELVISSSSEGIFKGVEIIFQDKLEWFFTSRYNWWNFLTNLDI